MISNIRDLGGLSTKDTARGYRAGDRGVQAEDVRITPK